MTDPFIKKIVRRALAALNQADLRLTALQLKHEKGELDLGNEYYRVELCGGVVYNELTALRDMVEQAKQKGIY